MKVRIVKEELLKPVTMADMKVGQFAKVISAGFKGHIVAKAYGNLVISLTDPAHVWGEAQSQRLHTVQLFVAGDSITITFRGKKETIYVHEEAEEGCKEGVPKEEAHDPSVRAQGLLGLAEGGE